MNFKNEKLIFRKYRPWVFVTIIAALVLIFRILLPIGLTTYVNSKLKDIPGVEARIHDIDLALYKLTILLKDGTVSTENGSFQILAPKIYFSLVANELLRFRLAGRIQIIHPTFQFYALPHKQAASVTEKKNEKKDARFYGAGLKLRQMIPAVLKEFRIENGTSEFVGQPQALSMKNIELRIENVATRRLRQNGPGQLEVSAITPGGGELEARGAFDPQDPWPDAKIEFKISDLQLPALAPATRKLTKVDAEKGRLDITGEFVTSKGKVEGYIKPLLKHVDLTGERPQEGFWRTLWEYILQGANAFFKNDRTGKVAGKIIIQGDLTKPGVDVREILRSAFQNAFGTALSAKFDRSVKLQPDLPPKKK